MALLDPLAARADDAARLQPPEFANETIVDRRQAIIENLRHDAALADVFFLDRASGWAVGDRGVIWHTADGGETWRQQSSGVACQLQSIFFVDARRGWAAGGESRPYSTSSRGAVLRTNDGGATWSVIPRLVLPRLARISFFDQRHGVAFGDATAYFPSGVFVTQDGGDTWLPLPADRGAAGWHAGDFLDAENGAVAGPGGAVATLARRQIVHSPLAAPSLRSYRAMRLVAPTGGWLVGDGGVVLTTKDLGHSWQSPPTELPEFSQQFDFHALEVLGQHVWIAGSPGTCVFHSADGGHAWEVLFTGQRAPLRALTFVDSSHGWAVGDLGNILMTRDGGRMWQSQQSGAQRAALLGIFASPADVPFELIAGQGVAEGYITAIDILHVPATEHRGTAAFTDVQRTREAMLLSGAASAELAWRFPLPPSELALAPADVLESLDRANDGRALQQILSHLVRELRTWRPDVIVTHHSKLEMSQPTGALIQQLVMKAVRSAADPTQHVEPESALGLDPWQVKKVYGVLPAGSRGEEVLATGRFSPPLGNSLADFASPARSLITSIDRAPPDTYELELLWNTIGDAGTSRGLFGGIMLLPGSDARRRQLAMPNEDDDGQRQLATRRRHLQELLQRSEGNLAWAAQVSDLSRDMAAEHGAPLLNDLADGYRATGRLDLAADTYYLLARRYPDHPVTDRALVWLVHFYASRESAHRLAQDQLTSVRQTSYEQALATAPAVSLSGDDRLRRAIQLAEHLKTARPALYAEPRIRFAEVASHRQLGLTNPAKRYFLTLRALPENDPWRKCAETEEWLAQPGDLPPPKALGACRPAARRPHLDGKLTESIWETAGRFPLRGDDAGRIIVSDQKRNATDKIVRPTNRGEVRLAYDREFLYVVIRCPQAPGGDYRADDRPRPRDADLTQRDRVALSIDIDRDYTTAYELTVDARGWTHDACCGDANWNPNWYVAATSDDSTWTVEAALPLAELVAEPPAARDVWAVSLRRTVPRVGYQTWAGDATSDESPDQFGLVIFE
jgi:photosystem II stability/assembly factor-like uncharacterized protein